MTITVSSGVTSHGFTISSGDPLVVLSGGDVDNSTILSGGSATLSSGAVGIGLTVSSGGVVQGAGYLEQGAVAGALSGLTITNPSGEGYVVNLLSGGTASDVTVDDFGTLKVSLGASAAGTTVGNAGHLEIYGSAAGAVVEDVGDIDVYHGGVASDFTVALSGTLFLVGGTVSNTTVESGGTLELDTGTASGASVQSGGTFDIVGELTSNITLTESATSTTALSGVTVSSGGYLNIDDATIASGATVSLAAGAIELVETVAKGGVVLGPGTLDNTTVFGAVSGVADLYNLTIASGGTASGVTVDAGASYPRSELVVDPGGTAAGTLLQDDSVLYNYGSAAGTIVGSGAEEDDEGSASGDVVQSGGLLVLNGTASDETVLSGGTFQFNGALTSNLVAGSGTSTRVLNGVTVSSGGTIDVNYAQVLSGVTLSVAGTVAGTLAVSSGGVVRGPGTAEDLQVSSGGSASGLTLQYGYISSGGAGADMVIQADAIELVYGSATGDTVQSAASLVLESGGTATHETIQSGGGVTFGEDVTNDYTQLAGAVTATTVLGGVTISSGGYAGLSGATVADGATVSVAALAQVYDTTVAAGGSLAGPGWLTGATFVAGAVSGVTVGDPITNLSASLEILSGGVASGVTALGYLRTIQIDAGASATGTMVVGDAIIDVLGSATATDLEASVEYVFSGGVTSGDVVESGGKLFVSSGGVAGGATVSSAGAEYVDAGGVASGTTVSSGGGAAVLGGGGSVDATVSSGGKVDVLGTTTGDVVRAGGHEAVSSGGGAVDATVSSGGVLYVLASGTAKGTQVSAGGGELVSSGGVANGTTVLSGGAGHVYSGGVASGTALSGGREIISSGGSAVGATAASGGVLYVLGSGTAKGTVVSSGGYELISSGGVAGDTTVLSGGAEDVYSGGLDDHGVVSSGGAEAIYAGGTAGDLTLISGGRLIDDGEARFDGVGTLDGTLSGSGAIVESGTGTLVLSGDGLKFAGLAVISGGTIDLAAKAALGTGGVVFAAPSSGSAVLQIDAADAPKAGGTFANVISNFNGANEDIDLTSIAFVSGASATVSGSSLVLTDGGETYTFNIAGGIAGAYPVLSDGHGGTLIDPKALAFAQNAAAFAPADAAKTVLVSSTSPVTQTPFLHATASAGAGRL